MRRILVENTLTFKGPYESESYTSAECADYLLVNIKKCTVNN